MPDNLIMQNRQVWLNLKNYLAPMNLAEVQEECENSQGIRKALIAEYIGSEFCTCCNDNAGSANLDEHGECPECSDWEDCDDYDDYLD
jgi:hypothetical protein